MVREPPSGLHRSRHCRPHKQVGAVEWLFLQLIPARMPEYQDGARLVLGSEERDVHG